MARILGPVLSLAVLLGAGGHGHAGPAPHSPPPAQPGGWIPSPGPWEVLQREDLSGAEATGLRWRLLSERRRLGTLLGGRTEVVVHLPRLRVLEVQGGDSIEVAVVMPADNRGLSVLAPGDSAVSAVPDRETEDRWGRWPNLCSLTILDARARLDLDGDGTMEVAVRRVCSCASAECSGIAFVSLGPDGVRLLDAARLVPKIALGAVRVRDIHPSGQAARPILDVEPEMLTGCRFMAWLGIRGEADCEDCCLFPVLIRPTEEGYEVYFDRQRQMDALRRAERDLGWVAAGPAGEPIRSTELAMIARAASFFYLTGTGDEAAETIYEALGPRSNDWGLRSLLRKIDDLFMASAPRSR